MSPVVIGLDPSMTAAGIAVIAQNAAPTVRTIGSRGHRADVIALRSTRIVKQAAAVLACVDPASTLVVIEGPALGLNSPGAWDRAGLWWGIVAGCRSRGVPVAVCAPQTRAKWATCSGRADKTQVLAAMRQMWPGVTIRDDNQADALAFASMGAQMLGWDVPERGVRQPHRAAVMGAEAYDDCIHVPCPRCQAERDAYCRNPVSDRPAQVPCLMRLRAAETDRETGSSTGSAGAPEKPSTATPGGSKPQHGSGR